MKEIYSIWGIPSSPVHGYLESTIKQLANVHGGPTFSPHITVVGDTSLPKNQLEDAISEIAANRPKALFKLGKVGYSSNFYKAIFVNTIKDQELRRLRDVLIAELSLDSREYNPHISLLYGIYASTILRDIVSNTIMQDYTAKIARLDLVPITPDPSEWEPIYSATMNVNS